MNIRLIDICLPDYFPGSNVPFVQIAIEHGMTSREIEEAIRCAVDSEDFEVEGWEGQQYAALRRMIESQLLEYLLNYSHNMASNDERDTYEPVYAYVAVLV